VIMRSFVLVTLLCATPAIADENPMFREQTGARGFLYEVRPKKGDGHLYVFGTIHVGTADRTPFTHAVRDALGKSSQLALEADPSDLGGIASALGGQVIYPAGDSLDRHISAATLGELKKVLQRLKLDEARILKMRLWLVPMALGLAEGEQRGLSGSYGSEVYLAAWAKSHTMPIVELEGAEAQMKLIASEPEDLQLESLDEALKDLQSGESVKKLDKIMKTWNDGDLKGAEEIVKKAHESKRPSERDFARRLLDERNVGMDNKAEELLKSGKVTFLAVGTAHLFGAKGLLALLKSHGFVVTPLK
jgi:uncharacterized protein YbaP (TraB family)